MKKVESSEKKAQQQLDLADVFGDDSSDSDRRSSAKEATPTKGATPPPAKKKKKSTPPGELFTLFWEYWVFETNFDRRITIGQT